MALVVQTGILFLPVTSSGGFKRLERRLSLLRAGTGLQEEVLGRTVAGRTLPSSAAHQGICHAPESVETITTGAWAKLGLLLLWCDSRMGEQGTSECTLKGERHGISSGALCTDMHHVAIVVRGDFDESCPYGVCWGAEPAVAAEAGPLLATCF